MAVDQSLETFANSVRGAVLRPADQGYESARRIWNGMIDRTPAVIVRCADAADVVAAVNFARDQSWWWPSAAAATAPRAAACAMAD